MSDDKNFQLNFWKKQNIFFFWCFVSFLVCYVPERSMCEKEALLPKKRIFGTNAPSKQGRFQGGRSPTLKSKKVTLFTMVLYKSENNTSKPIPNKTFVMFELSYCSRYMAILSSIVLSQQSSEVYIISSCSSEAIMKLTTTEISHPKVTSWTWPCLSSAKLRSTNRLFAQWNLILEHLQPSNTLEKHENKGKIFELNM